VKDFFLDNENHIYNRLGYPPRQFWLSVKNKEDFNGLIKNMAVEWFPFVQFHLPAIVVWTAIENNSADRVQAPVKKKPKDKPQDSSALSQKLAVVESNILSAKTALESALIQTRRLRSDLK
jgi:hypothetical protein